MSLGKLSGLSEAQEETCGVGADSVTVLGAWLAIETG